MMHKRYTFLLLAAALAGCAGDPVYLDPSPPSLEANNPNGGIGDTVSIVSVPIRVETAVEKTKRQALANSLGLNLDQVPQARRDDLKMSVEFTFKNLDDVAGTATLQVTGANEFFRFDPSVFIVNPNDPNARPAPPLAGNRPYQVPALGTVSGVIREDEMADAMQDLDAITRAGFAPEFTAYSIWPTPDITGGTGMLQDIPSAAIPAFLELDVSFTATTHMVMEYVLRVRDFSGKLVPAAAPGAALVTASDVVYTPPPPSP